MTKAPTRKTKRASPKKAAPGFQRKFWIILCVVSSAWMFFFGLMVGRGTIPPLFDIPKFERELANLAKPDEKPFANSEQETIPKPDITDSDPFEALQAPDPVLNIPEEKPTTDTVPSIGAIKTKRLPASLQKKKRGQTVKTTNITPPASPAPLIKKARFVVQAAAYRSLDAANEAVADLQQMGYRAYVASVETEGKGIWHRVRLGPYGSKVDADRVVQRLKEKKIAGYIIQ